MMFSPVIIRFSLIGTIGHLYYRCNQNVIEIGVRVVSDFQIKVNIETSSNCNVDVGMRYHFFAIW